MQDYERRLEELGNHLKGLEELSNGAVNRPDMEKVPEVLREVVVHLSAIYASVFADHLRNQGKDFAESTMGAIHIGQLLGEVCKSNYVVGYDQGFKEGTKDALRQLSRRN